MRKAGLTFYARSPQRIWIREEVVVVIVTASLESPNSMEVTRRKANHDRCVVVRMKAKCRQAKAGRETRCW